jgi:hypothetical protein
METRRMFDSSGDAINYMEVLTRRMDLQTSRRIRGEKIPFSLTGILNRRKARSFCKFLSSLKSFILYIKRLCTYVCIYVCMCAFSWSISYSKNSSDEDLSN